MSYLTLPDSKALTLLLRRCPCAQGENRMRPPSAALDDDFARVTSSPILRLAVGFLAFLAADVASAIVTLFWL